MQLQEQTEALQPLLPEAEDLDLSEVVLCLQRKCKVFLPMEGAGLQLSLLYLKYLSCHSVHSTDGIVIRIVYFCIRIDKSKP